MAFIKKKLFHLILLGLSDSSVLCCMFMEVFHHQLHYNVTSLCSHSYSSTSLFNFVQQIQCNHDHIARYLCLKASCDQALCFANCYYRVSTNENLWHTFEKLPWKQLHNVDRLLWTKTWLPVGTCSRMFTWCNKEFSVMFLRVFWCIVLSACEGVSMSMCRAGTDYLRASRSGSTLTQKGEIDTRGCVHCLCIKKCSNSNLAT